MKPLKKTGNHDVADCRDVTGGKDSTPDVMQRLLGSSTLRMKLRELQLVAKYQQRKQSKLVSIIMPTWNRVHIIKRAIDSVMAQSYNNFELIVSDDGSTDGTGDFIRTQYEACPHLYYVFNEHRGVSYTRNSAMEKANGELIAYLDSDNQWCANYLMVMVNSLEDSLDKDCAYCAIRVINEIHQTRFTRLVDYDRVALIAQNYIDMNIFIHNRTCFERYGGFSHGLEPFEDWELILRYTRENSPLVVECCLANYYITSKLNHQSLVCETHSSYQKIQNRYRI